MTIKISFLAAIFLLSFSLTAICTPGDFEIIKKRVQESLKVTTIDDNSIDLIISTLEPNGTWPEINYDDVSNEGFQHSRHSANLVFLAKAYNAKSSEFYESKSALTAIELALKHWVENDYICENWWHNQVGTPNNLVQVMLLVGDKLPGNLIKRAQPIIERAHINAPGARPGGDRIKIAGIQAKHLLFTGDEQTFEKVIDVIENEIKYVEWIGRKYGYTYLHHESGFANRSEGGRGIQFGNSFHHREDGVNNTLSYGLDYANAFIEWAVFTANTRYIFAEDKLERLVDYYLDGICKTAAFGKYPDPGAKNRSISRVGSLKPYTAHAAENLLKTTSYRKNDLQEIVEIRKNGVRPTLRHSTFFWNSEHFTFQRPDWFTSVRMYSRRNYNMEMPYNSEGLLNHHRGDGANHISLTGDEYYDIFPVFDYQKVPGTTIMQKASLPDPNQIQKLGQTDYVGAVTDGTYGAVAFDFKSPHDPLIARKSWFFFDEEYVCLGAGISCKQQLPVVTTLNQCLLRGDVTVSADNRTSVVRNDNQTIKNVDWVFHDGIGYVFPEPEEIELSNTNVSGSWWNISKQTSTPRDEVKLDVFKLWLNHGRRPSDAAYQYIVVPATTIEMLKNNSSEKSISILKNTPEVQAVFNKGLGIFQAVFYEGGEVLIHDDIKIQVHNPGIVMVKIKDGIITDISVSDPNRNLTRFNFTVSRKSDKQEDGFIASWNETEGHSHVSVKLPQNNFAGSSITIKL